MSKVKLSRRKQKLYEKTAKAIKFLRRNPCIACELLLGIKLTDSQKYVLQESWNKPYVVWNCCRNFGKSFLGDVIIMLKALLYLNQRIYIISNSGNQAIETFLKMEDIAKQRIDSIPSLKDIFINELVKNNNSDGFIHDKASHRCELFNGSKIFTLNSVPKNIRGKRANLLFIDESAFCSEELINAALPFLTQESSFKASTDKNFDIKTERKSVPNQVIYASSAGDIDSMHAKVYKEYALKMIAGDSNYFVVDMPCDIPLQPYIDGKPTKPYLTQKKIDDEMRVNPEKAMREYYNKFQTDGGESQIVKWATIRRNEKFLLPEMHRVDDGKYAIAFDPARSTDNSIITVMKILYDKKRGYYGRIVNCMNLIDLGKKRKMQMRTPNQMKFLKQTILNYNGACPDYENIEVVAIDAGAGGGGITAYADYMLEEWVDSRGIKHKGFIDDTYELYVEYGNKYPNASRKLKLLSPQKYRTQMVQEFIELMNLDLIEFPKEYNNNGYVNILSGNDKDEIKTYKLSIEEELALINIDIMKTEITSIHSFKNSEGVITRYALPKEKEKKMHDDRFYTIIMLAHYLYQKRRQSQLNRHVHNNKIDINKLFSVYRKPKMRA